MAEISFYHLTTTPLERALPQLVEKAYEAGLRTLVLADKVRIKQIDDTMWTSYQQKFLPHGTTNPEIQPIFISDKISNDNRQVLAITNGEAITDDLTFKKVLDIFDGNIEADLEKARARWKSYKDKAYDIKYWAQDEKGKWVQNSN